MRTVAHDPHDPAEVDAIQTPEGEPDAELVDPENVEHDADESAEDVMPA